jgi:hypothetical protein
MNLMSLITMGITGEPIANLTSEGLKTLTNQVANLTNIFQAIGGFILAYILFNIIALILDRKKNQELVQIRLLLEKMNKKLGK